MESTKFSDVWNRIGEVILCGYCATEVTADASRCHHCHRKLATSVFRYPRPSSNFYIFLLLLVALIQLFMIQIIIDVLADQPWPVLASHALFMPVLTVVAVFVFRRHFWAYVASLVTLLLAGTQIGLVNLAPAVFGREVLGTPLSGLYEGFGRMVSLGVFGLVAGCLVLAFIIGLLRVAPDFEREKVYLWAIPPRDLNRRPASAAHFSAIRYADRDLWGLAAIYWQRAVIADPGRLLYYLHLIDTYHRLGFQERARDMLEQAGKIAQTAAAHAKLLELKVRINSPGSPD